MSLALNGVNFFFFSLLSFLYGALVWTILFLAYIVTFFAASNHTSFYPVRAHPFYSVDGLSKTDTAAKLFHIPPLTNELHLDGVTKPFSP